MKISPVTCLPPTRLTARRHSAWPGLALVLGLALSGGLAMAQGLKPSTNLDPRFIGQRPAPLDTRPAAPQSADFIVAVVNSEPITNSEVMQRLGAMVEQMSQQGGSLPPRSEMARQVLERLINDRAQLQVARESGVKVDDASVDQAEQNIARQNQMTVEQLRVRLQREGIKPTRFRDNLRDQITLSRLRERDVDGRVRVTEQDVDQFLAEEKAGADLSQLEINLAQILVAVPENASAAQVAALEARARRALEKARAGEDFAALVKEYSDAGDRGGAGGQMGLRPADRYPDLFVNTTRDLPTGGISDVVRSAAGFHILKVIERQSGGVPNMKVTQNRARHILLRPSAQLSEAAARDRLTDFRRRIQAGTADFATLARENSQDGSADKGGDLGWASPGLFVPEFEEVVNSLAPGEIAPPLISRFGVHLIQLQERREVALTAQEQRQVARSLVRDRKLEEAYANWAQEVRGRAYVELREPPQP